VLSGELVRKHQLPFQARFEDVIVEIQDPIQAIENDLNPTIVQILFVHLQWEARIEPDTKTRVFLSLDDLQNCGLKMISTPSIIEMRCASLREEPMPSVVEPITGREIHLPS